MSAAIRKAFRDRPELGQRISKQKKGKKRSASTREKMSRTRSQRILEKGFSRPKKNRSEYVSTKTNQLEISDSSYEFRRFQALDSSPLVKTWTKKHGIKIVYSDGKKRHRYHPDILVEYVDGRKFLEEVKGYVFDQMTFTRKNVAALGWCGLHGITFRIIRKDDLEVVA